MHTYDVKYFLKYRNIKLHFYVGLSIFRNLYKIKLIVNMYMNTLSKWWSSLSSNGGFS